MGQLPNLGTQHGAVVVDIVRSDFKQIVEITRDHIAALNFRNFPYRLIETFKCVFTGFVHGDLNHQYMTSVQLVRIQIGAVAANHARLLQPADPLGTGGFGEVNPAGQFDDGQAPMLLKLTQDLTIYAVNLNSLYSY